MTIRHLPFTLRVTPVLAAQETDDLTQIGQSGSGTVLHRLEHLVGTLRVLVPQSRGRLGTHDDTGEVMAGDVVEIASQGIATGPQLALDPLTLLALEQLLLPFKELGLVTQRLVESLTP